MTQHDSMQSEQQSYLKTLDPRTKLVALLALGALTLLSDSWWRLFVTAAVVVVAMAVSPVSIHNLITQLRRIFWFALIITAIHAFTVSGRVMADGGGMYVTEEGVLQGLRLSSQVGQLLMLSFLFSRLTSIAEIVDGIEAFCAPFHKWLGTTVSLVSLTLYFVPQLVHSAQRIKAAQIARGADVSSSFFSRVKFASGAALPLFVSAFRSSHQLAEAMDARCYDPTAERSPFSVSQLKRRDFLAFGFLAALTLLFAYIPCLGNSAIPRSA